MANDTANITIKLDKKLKDEASILFKRLGMSMTTGINIYLRQCVRTGEIPFKVTTGEVREGADNND